MSAPTRMMASPHIAPELMAALNPLGRYGVELDAPLAPHTSFRIGGPAAALLTVSELPHLIAALRLLDQWRTPYLILGGGSNVLISDAGIPSLVILNQCRKITWPDAITPDGLIIAEAGAPLAGFARAAIKQGWAGLAWAVSVPGTVGGAVVGNAGAHGGAIADNLHSVQVWRDGAVSVVPAAELHLGYRRSDLKPRVNQPGHAPVILSASFRLAPDAEGSEAERAEGYIDHRRRTQPVDKSAGSIFKNPPGDFAGRLIEAVDLKGAGVGGAAVSVQHANFIINTGDATAADVVNLMNLIRRAVYERFHIILEPEIQLIGDWRNGPNIEPFSSPT